MFGRGLFGGRRWIGRAGRLTAAGLVVILAGAGSAYAVGRGHHQHKGHSHGGGLTAVEAATATAGTAISQLTLSGTTVATASLPVTPGTTGRVQMVAAQLGEVVQAGQLLVSLASPVLQAQMAEAQAAVATAQAKLSAAEAGPSAQAVAVAQAEVAKAQVALQAAEQAYQQAQAGGSGPPGGRSATSSGASTAQAAEAVSEAQAALTLAEAQAAQAEAPPAPTTLAPLQAAVTQAQAAEAVTAAEVAQEQVTAPFAGTVVSVAAVVGEQVSPTTTVVTLDGSGLSVQAPVSESELALVHPGEAATISLPGSSASQAATVTAVSPAANASSLTFAVELIPVSDPSWLAPGEAISVGVVTSRTSGAVLVPANSVVTIEGHPQVFVVGTGHSVHLVDVSPGISDGTTTAVGGISPGDEVVTVGQTYLAPGDRVRVTATTPVPPSVTGSTVGGLLTAPVTATPSATKPGSGLAATGSGGGGSGGGAVTGSGGAAGKAGRG